MANTYGQMTRVASAAVAVVLAADVALAQTPDLDRLVIGPEEQPIYTEAAAGLTIYSVEKDYFQATGESHQVWYIEDSVAGVGCTWNISGNIKSGYEGTQSFVNVTDMQSNLSCEVLEDQSRDISSLFPATESQVSGGNAVVTFQQQENGASQTVYSRELVDGAWQISISEKVNAAFQGVDIQRIDGHVLRPNEGMVTIAESEFNF